MLRHEGSSQRELRTIDLDADLVVVGGGMAGTCCAITAARAGIRVVLVQDRPVLGGNASSEVRLWILGATSHMGNNNRWSREGGVIDELLVENTFRNPEGNPVVFDTVLLEKVTAEPNLRLLLNTAVHDVEMDQKGRIQSARAYCSQNSTQYELRAPLFCDASGDGILGFLSGAAFRIGAESRVEFGELLAPAEPRQELLGHSLYFYTKDTGRPVRFVAPSYALDDITKIPRYHQFNTKAQGCQLWWIEFGGRRDTVYDTEEIKWELWKIVYGVWNYIKNSGKFPEAETMTLEWVGQIPGKRESRRFEGDYMLIQQDIVQQRTHYDAISFGGWAIDLHPSDGIYSAESPCTQWHSKGVYQIPYRTMYSRNVPNLFLAGRIISASHVAFGSSRVMATCAHNAQAVGMAAAICHEQQLSPRDLAHPEQISLLQKRMLRSGQHIPNVLHTDEHDLARYAKISASSEFDFQRLRRSGNMVALTTSRAMLLPVQKGRMSAVTFFVEPHEDTDLAVELRSSSQIGNFTPDLVRERCILQFRSSRHCDADHVPVSSTRHATASLSGGSNRSDGVSEAEKVFLSTELSDPAKGVRPVTVSFRSQIPESGYVLVCLMENPNVSVETSDQVLTGVVSLVHRNNGRVATNNLQSPPDGIGIDCFEFWTPERRPDARNLALEIEPSLTPFIVENVVNGIARPTVSPNAWVAALDDPQPALRLHWDKTQVIRRIELSFDTDFDHAMESVLMGHPESIMPQCVRSYRICDCEGNLLAECQDNYQTRNVIELNPPVETDSITIELNTPSNHTPASIFEIRCY